MKKAVILAFAALTVTTLAGCNTVNGAGKDLKSAGSAMSGASGENKPKGN